ncbi:MAG: aldo/keto reductase [Planctomycetia bacterium]|nr:aldo/keto reductase [Planctomycetia bacterium]
MERRQFLKTVGGTAAVSAAVLTGCGEVKRPGASPPPRTPDDIPKDKMTYRVHPRSGDKVSLLGFGCMRFPFLPVGAGGGEELIDQDAVNEMIDYALDHGVNYFDSSPVYCRGLSERATGIALSRHKRDKFFVSTKLSNMSQGARSREASIAMYRNSFKQLQVDYIDYYLVHSVANYEIFKQRYLDNGMLDFLLAEREAGRIRHFGWSFHGEKEFFDWTLTPECGVDWDFVLIQLNYLDWRHATGRNVNAEYLYGELQKRNIPAMVMEPLLGGRLARTNYKAQGMLKQAEPEKSAASWALRFAGSPPGVLTVLSGMTYLEHLKDNLRTYCPLNPLSGSEYKLLEEVARVILDFQTINCTECNYCMPCPYGLDIPGIIMHYNRCLNEGNFPNVNDEENYQRARRAFLIGYDRAIPKLRQAAMCTKCNLCHPECPQFIRISDEMEKIDQFVEKLRKEK